MSKKAIQNNGNAIDTTTNDGLMGRGTGRYNLLMITVDQYVSLFIPNEKERKQILTVWENSKRKSIDTISGYKGCPKTFKDYTKQLDDVRTLRNELAHTYMNENDVKMTNKLIKFNNDVDSLIDKIQHGIQNVESVNKKKANVQRNQDDSDLRSIISKIINEHEKSTGNNLKLTELGKILKERDIDYSGKLKPLCERLDFKIYGIQGQENMYVISNRELRYLKI